MENIYWNHEPRDNEKNNIDKLGTITIVIIIILYTLLNKSVKKK